MRIRSCQPSEQAAVVRLVTGILKKEFPGKGAAYPTEDLEQLSQTYRPPDSTFLVAEEDHRVVGTCGVKAEDARTAILRRLFVDSAYRGRGIGSGLLQQALQFCRQRGFREVVIRTAESMEQAIRLCRSAGFQEEGSWSLGGVTLVRFRLKIT